MEFSTRLPSQFNSWFDFYKTVKEQFSEDQQDIYLPVDSLDKTHSPGVRPYVFSVQYIKEKALEELYVLRKQQTFTFDELYLIQHGLYALRVSERFSNSDSRVEAIQHKIGELIIDTRKKSL